MTSVDPRRHQKTEYFAKKTPGAYLLDIVNQKYKEGRCMGLGKWRRPRHDGVAGTSSIMWDGKDVFINGSKTPAFKDVSGPLWAVIDIAMGMPRISIVHPGKPN